VKKLVKKKNKTIAKIVGSLGLNIITENINKLDGILLKKDFQHLIVSAKDLPTYSDIKSLSILQKIVLPRPSDNIWFENLTKIFENILIFNKKYLSNNNKEKEFENNKEGLLLIKENENENKEKLNNNNNKKEEEEEKINNDENKNKNENEKDEKEEKIIEENEKKDEGEKIKEEDNEIIIEKILIEEEKIDIENLETYKIKVFFLIINIFYYIFNNYIL
jgi:hypothetical protein